jgi:putative hemolysin
MRLGALAQTFNPISYADPAAPLWERALINAVEVISGRKTLVRLYESWRERWQVTGLPLWSSALYWLGTPLVQEGAAWPPQVKTSERLVVIANHPFGLLDGIAICALAEQLRRPFKILAHSRLMTVPEAAGYFLPIDFSETEEATRNNIKVRQQALAALKAGETIVIFPAGGVSTAPVKLSVKPIAEAEDLPWKNFAYRLIRTAGATVLPLYFEGQNGPMFHVASKVSMAWRIALLIGELNKRRGRPVKVQIGQPIRWPEIAAIDTPGEAMRELRRRVYALRRPQGSPNL